MSWYYLPKVLTFGAKHIGMRQFLVTLFIAISSIALAQTSTVVQLKDGRSVLLKPNFTWEYIELAQEKTIEATVPLKKVLTEEEIEAAKPALPTSKSCVPDGFVEPKTSTKVQAYLKRGRATLKHIKRRVAKDNNCSVDDVTLLSFRESNQKGTYTFCANGKTVRYKRLGFTISKRIKI